MFSVLQLLDCVCFHTWITLPPQNADMFSKVLLMTLLFNSGVLKQRPIYLLCQSKVWNALFITYNPNQIYLERVFNLTKCEKFTRMNTIAMWCKMSSKDQFLVFPMTSLQETTDDHPHLDTIIAALGQVQNNGKYILFIYLNRHIFVIYTYVLHKHEIWMHA